MPASVMPTAVTPMPRGQTHRRYTHNLITKRCSNNVAWATSTPTSAPSMLCGSRGCVYWTVWWIYCSICSFWIHYLREFYESFEGLISCFSAVNPERPCFQVLCECFLGAGESFCEGFWVIADFWSGSIFSFVTLPFAV
jgi:hypothetical protein